MKAVICGAGIAGLTVSWWLERYGWDVLVVERADTLRAEGYMIDFFGSGYDVAEEMGLLPRLRRESHHINQVTYVTHTGREASHLDYAATASNLGGRLLALMRADLEHALYDALDGRAPIRFGTSVDAVDPDGGRVMVDLSDGTRVRADLLVGADGIHSKVRHLAFGNEARFLRYLGYHTAAYTFDDSSLAARIGPTMALLSQPGRQAGFYPLGDRHVAAFLVHQRAEASLPTDPRREVRQTYAGMGWVVDDALSRCPAPPGLYYDQVSQVVLPHWSRGPITLVGDAAGAVSLLAGQGASMAMASGYLLAAEVAAEKEIPSALRRYEALLRPTVERYQAAGRRTAQWIAPTSRWRITMRDTFLRLAALPGASRLLNPVFSAGSHSVIPRRTGAGGQRR
jgi:2-polyprenyl-6-methoxyphenol hydroxylase-like FAD-dependent oxidoreductase